MQLRLKKIGLKRQGGDQAPLEEPIALEAVAPVARTFKLQQKWLRCAAGCLCRDSVVYSASMELDMGPMLVWRVESVKTLF